MCIYPFTVYHPPVPAIHIQATGSGIFRGRHAGEIFRKTSRNCEPGRRLPGDERDAEHSASHGHPKRGGDRRHHSPIVGAAARAASRRKKSTRRSARCPNTWAGTSPAGRRGDDAVSQGWWWEAGSSVAPAAPPPNAVGGRFSLSTLDSPLSVHSVPSRPRGPSTAAIRMMNNTPAMAAPGMPITRACGQPASKTNW